MMNALAQFRWRTRGRLRAVALLALLILLLTACGAPDPQPLRLNPEPWANGEVSAFRVTARDGKAAGVMRYKLNMGQLRSGEQGWIISREVESLGDTEIVAVEAALGNLLPQYAMLVRANPQGTERVATQYSGGYVDMVLTTRQDNTTYQRSTAPTDARDERTVLQMVRMLPLADGYAVRFNSYLPVADQLDRITLRVLKREDVDVPAGVFDAWLVELNDTRTNTRAWIGVEPPHPLLKIEDGRNGAVYELEQLDR